MENTGMGTYPKKEEIEKAFNSSGNDFDRIIHNLFVKTTEPGIDPNRKILIFRSFFPKDRYFFDFNMNLTEWAQLDTDQDAHYYGNWINPKLRAKVEYAEGDVCVVIALDDDAFLEEIKTTMDWFKSNGNKAGIDFGLNPCGESITFKEKYEEDLIECVK